jgi:hypothetical protein
MLLQLQQKFLKSTAASNQPCRPTLIHVLDQDRSGQSPKKSFFSDNPVNQESIFNPTEPGTYHEAINCLETDFWIKGINEEYTTLENNTWILCQLPADQKAIVGKWVLKYKPVLRQLPHDTRPGS